MDVRECVCVCVYVRERGREKERERERETWNLKLKALTSIIITHYDRLVYTATYYHAITRIYSIYREYDPIHHNIRILRREWVYQCHILSSIHCIEGGGGVGGSVVVPEDERPNPTFSHFWEETGAPYPMIILELRGGVSIGLKVEYHQNTAPPLIHIPLVAAVVNFCCWLKFRFCWIWLSADVETKSIPVYPVYKEG